MNYYTLIDQVQWWQNSVGRMLFLGGGYKPGYHIIKAFWSYNFIHASKNTVGILDNAGAQTL